MNNLKTQIMHSFHPMIACFCCHCGFNCHPNFSSWTQCQCFSYNDTCKCIVFVSHLIGMYDPDQSGSGLLDILRGGTERFLTNIKDTSSKVIQSVARYGAPIFLPWSIHVHSFWLYTVQLIFIVIPDQWAVIFLFILKKKRFPHF